MLITGANDDEETSEAQRGDVAGAVPAADEQRLGDGGVLPTGRDQRGIWTCPALVDG